MTTNNEQQQEGNKNSDNGLTWFRTVELTNDLLREMISYYAREITLEENKPSPNPDTIHRLEIKQQEIVAINDAPASFASLEQMNKIIAVLSPLVKQLYA